MSERRSKPWNVRRKSTVGSTALIFLRFTFLYFFLTECYRAKVNYMHPYFKVKNNFCFINEMQKSLTQCNKDAVFPNMNIP